MLVVDIENSVFDYQGENNVIILPITGFVRMDGKLAARNSITKEFFDTYPSLSKKWAYMIQNNVLYPSFSSYGTELIGIVERLHYASSIDKSSILDGFWYIKELSLQKPNHIFYFVEIGGEEEEKELREIFKESTNVVLLKERKENHE